MNPRRLLRTIASSVCAFALLFAATGTPAQTTIYKQVDLAGRITFTDRPDPSLPAQSMASPLEAPKPPAGIALMASQRSAAIDLKEAARRLAQAQLARSEGADPLPAERTHGPGAGVPNQRYWQRQEKLRVLVEQAQQRVNETRQPLLAQR